MMLWAPMVMAFMPDAQTLLIVVASDVFGMPARGPSARTVSEGAKNGDGRE